MGEGPPKPIFGNGNEHADKPIEHKEASRWIVAKCGACGWSTSLQVTMSSLAAKSLFLQELAENHEVSFKHHFVKVKFK